MKFFTKERCIGALVLFFILALVSLFLYDLRPVNASVNAAPVIFEIQQGQSFRTIADDLATANLIRSKTAFELYAILAGHATSIKPGLYRLSAAMNTADITATIAGGDAGEATVLIPEGSNMYQIDVILSNALVLKPGVLVAYATAHGLEGKLFPDTYNFYTNANVVDVATELVNTFAAKAVPLLTAGENNTPSESATTTLILASILEKEVPSQADQELVAGILVKRLAAHIPLDIDATVCYAKQRLTPSSVVNCADLTPLDFKIDSPYNTYLYKGLPPGPIGNPGVSAIVAASHPSSSPYWYYLSDPATGKTIFAKTLDEQNQNKVKYLVQ